MSTTTRTVANLAAAALGEPAPGWEAVHAAESALLTDWLTEAASARGLNPAALDSEEVVAVVDAVSGRRHGLADDSRHHALLDSLQTLTGAVQVLRTRSRRLMRTAAAVARADDAAETDRGLLRWACEALQGVGVVAGMVRDGSPDPTRRETLGEIDDHLAAAREDLDAARH